MDLRKIYRRASLNLARLTLAAIVVIPSAAEALTLNGQKIGEIYKRSGPSVDRKCSPTGSARGDVPWSPANTDMVIIDYRVVNKDTWSRSGFTISQVPANFDFQSYSQYLKEFEQLIETAAKYKNQEYEARFKQAKREFEQTINRLRSSHGSIVLTWHCQGDGLFGGRGKVSVTTEVDVMYKPNLDQISNYLRENRQQLEQRRQEQLSPEEREQIRQQRERIRQQLERIKPQRERIRPQRELFRQRRELFR